MKFDYKLFKEWPDRVKKRLKELSMTQDDLAKKMEVTRGAIAHYLGGRRVPPTKQFQKLAEILKVDPVWLQYGVDQSNTENKKYFPEIDTLNPVTRIPILSWKQIANTPDLENLDKLQISEYVPHLLTDELGHYALRVQGDAMTAPSAYMPSFREGDIIQVDQAKQPKHNDYVIAVLPGSDEAILRQYVAEGGKQYLKPLNQQYPLVDVDDGVRFCGVAVYRIG